MAELPELTILQQQMNQALTGRTITQAEITQEKCLNLPADEARHLLEGRTVKAVTRRGKWLLLHLEPAWHLLLNLGMGADLWHYSPGAALPAKYQFRLHLDDGSGFTCRFWWFGYIRLVAPGDLERFKETADLGPSPLEITPAELSVIARRTPRSTAKSLILDQEKLSGIGNAYAHDVLWQAKLHPLRKIGTLTDAELQQYHAAISAVMERAMDLGGLERDFYNQGGNMGNAGALFQIGYKEGKPCPACGTAIEKIKTGSTASFICPTCQTA